MKGRWGRRVFGSITTQWDLLSDDLVEYRLFYLEIQFGKDVWYLQQRETAEKLKRIPELYGIILDEMTRQLSEIVDRTKNTS